jgi:hypothetical protein
VDRATLLLLFAAAVLGFVVAAVTLALTGAFTAFRRNTGRYGAARGTLLTALGGLAFVLHFLPGRWGVLSIVAVGVVLIVGTLRGLAARGNRPIHEKLRDRPDILRVGVADLAAARMRRARRGQGLAIAAATVIALAGEAFDQAWLIGGGFVVALAAIAVSAMDVHRLQTDGALAPPGSLPSTRLRVLDFAATVVLAASVAGIGTAVRGLEYPPAWNRVEDGSVGLTYFNPSGPAGRLDAAAALTENPPPEAQPRVELELWRGPVAQRIVRIQFGRARPDGTRAPVTSGLYDPATRRTTALPAGSAAAMETGSMYLHLPLRFLPHRLTGWRLVVPSPLRGFESGYFPRSDDVAPFRVERPPHPLAPVAIEKVSTRLLRAGAERVLEGTLRIGGDLPNGRTVIVTLELGDTNVTPVSGDNRIAVVLGFGRKLNGSRPLTQASVFVGGEPGERPAGGIRAALVGHIVHFDVPVRAVGAGVCCYRATVSVKAPDGGETGVTAPASAKRPLALSGAPAPAAFPPWIPGFAVRNVRAALDRRERPPTLTVAFDVPQVPTVAAWMDYSVVLVDTRRRDRFLVEVFLHSVNGSVHATSERLVTMAPGSGPIGSKLAPEDVTIPRRGGGLRLRVPLPGLGSDICCWHAAVAAGPLARSSYLPLTFAVTSLTLGHSGEAVDVSR